MQITVRLKDEVVCARGQCHGNKKWKLWVECWIVCGKRKRKSNGTAKRLPAKRMAVKAIMNIDVETQPTISRKEKAPERRKWAQAAVEQMWTMWAFAKKSQRRSKRSHNTEVYVLSFVN